MTAVDYRPAAGLITHLHLSETTGDVTDVTTADGIIAMTVFSPLAVSTSLPVDGASASAMAVAVGPATVDMLETITAEDDWSIRLTGAAGEDTIAVSCWSSAGALLLTMPRRCLPSHAPEVVITLHESVRVPDSGDVTEALTMAIQAAASNLAAQEGDQALDGSTHERLFGEVIVYSHFQLGRVE